jgi:hypothetical protein
MNSVPILVFDSLKLPSIFSLSCICGSG